MCACVAWPKRVGKRINNASWDDACHWIMVLYGRHRRWRRLLQQQQRQHHKYFRALILVCCSWLSLYHLLCTLHFTPSLSSSPMSPDCLINLFSVFSRSIVKPCAIIMHVLVCVYGQRKAIFLLFTFSLNFIARYCLCFCCSISGDGGRKCMKHMATTILCG